MSSEPSEPKLKIQKEVVGYCPLCGAGEFEPRADGNEEQTCPECSEKFKVRKL